MSKLSEELLKLKFSVPFTDYENGVNDGINMSIRKLDTLTEDDTNGTAIEFTPNIQLTLEESANSWDEETLEMYLKKSTAVNRVLIQHISQLHKEVKEMKGLMFAIHKNTK